jgi:PAS domain S-box-containing protein
MVIVDAGGEIVLVNAQTEKLFGYPREELLRQRVEMLAPDRFRDRHSGHRAAYSADPHARSIGAGLELYGRRNDGTELPVEISLSPLETEAGTSSRAPSATSPTANAMSETRRTTSRLSYLPRTRSSAWTSTGTSRAGTTAPSASTATQAEMRGKSISVLVPPGHDDELPEILRRVRSGERFDHNETISARKDGTQVDLSLTASPIRDRDGSDVGVATIARESARVCATRNSFDSWLSTMRSPEPATVAVSNATSATRPAGRAATTNRRRCS